MNAKRHEVVEFETCMLEASEAHRHSEITEFETVITEEPLANSEFTVEFTVDSWDESKVCDDVSVELDRQTMEES